MFIFQHSTSFLFVFEMFHVFPVRCCDANCIAFQFDSIECRRLIRWHAKIEEEIMKFDLFRFPFHSLMCVLCTTLWNFVLIMLKANFRSAIDCTSKSILSKYVCRTKNKQKRSANTIGTETITNILLLFVSSN